MIYLHFTLHSYCALQFIWFYKKNKHFLQKKIYIQTLWPLFKNMQFILNKNSFFNEYDKKKSVKNCIIYGNGWTESMCFQTVTMAAGWLAHCHVGLAVFFHFKLWWHSFIHSFVRSCSHSWEIPRQLLDMIKVKNFPPFVFIRYLRFFAAIFHICSFSWKRNGEKWDIPRHVCVF